MTTKNTTIKLGDQPIYDLRPLSFNKKFLLGLQHTFAMFGATVLVPLLTGLNVSTTLLTAGLGTLLFHFITGFRVPVFLGSSFAFLAGYFAVAPNHDPAHLSLALGGVFSAGLVYLVVAALIRIFGVRKIMRFFPPVVTGPIVICIGLTLAPVAIGMSSGNWLVAGVAIATVIIANIYGRGMIKIMPILIGIVVAYLFALITGNVDTAALSKDVASDSIFALPLHSEYFASFDASAIIVVMPIAIATIMEHIGDISAVSATTNRNYLASPGLHRTLTGDGCATMLASLLGGPANTTYGENTGVLVLTRVYDPRVTRIAALFAIVFSFIPVISTVIHSIPVPVIGGISLILYGMISSIGVRNIVENRVDLTKTRNLIVAASILVCGLGIHFSDKVKVIFHVGDATVQLSALAVAAIVGILLNAILPGKDYVFRFDDEKTKETLVMSGVDTTAEGLHAEEIAKRNAEAEQVEDYTNKEIDPNEADDLPIGSKK